MRARDAGAALFAVLFACSAVAAEGQPPSPPPLVETPAEAPPAPEPGPDERAAPPESDAPTVAGSQRSASLAPPTSAGAVAGFLLVGVPVTWLAATIPAFATGGVSFFLLATIFNPSFSSGDRVEMLLPPAFAIGALVGVGITYALLPWMMTSFGDDRDFVGSYEAARARGWELGKWPLLVAVAALAVTTIGFGIRNPTVINVGIVATGGAYAAAWAFDIYGVLEGYNDSRRPRSLR